MLKLKKMLVLGIAAILTLGITSCGRHTHIFEEGWTFDETGHWHKASCEHSDEKEGFTSHTLIDSDKANKPATLTTPGKDYVQMCSVCEYATYNEIPVVKTYVRVNQNDEPDENGNYIHFGFYPQSKVTDATTLNSLNEVVSATKPTPTDSQGFTSYKYYTSDGTTGSGSNETEYMWYNDIDVDNDGNYDYRCVYFNQYRPEFTSGNLDNSPNPQALNGYNIGSYFFFKYEPIKWRILDQKDGKALLLAELILDSQEYNITLESKKISERILYANNYAESTIKKWLNETFYETAFTEYQNKLIVEVDVDNGAKTTGAKGNINEYACANTKDKVFLLSYQDVTNSVYGFDTYYMVDEARVKKGTDYAKAQGLYVYKEKMSSCWWLRSPYYENEAYARQINVEGIIYGYNSPVNRVYWGVVPALYIAL